MFEMYTVKTVILHRAISDLSLLFAYLEVMGSQDPAFFEKIRIFSEKI